MPVEGLAEAGAAAAACTSEARISPPGPEPRTAEISTPDGYAVRIEAATHPGAGDNPFHRRLRELVDPSKDPWKSLSATVARMVPIHADNLREEINRD